MDVTEILRQFGLTGQEAQLYLALLRLGAVSGYEAAKATGISRSNAYAALNSMVEKGVALQSADKVKKYAALSPSDLVGTLGRRCAEGLRFLEQNLPEKRGDDVPYFTIEGRANLLARIRALLAATRHRVYLSIHHGELGLFEKDLADCAARGIKTVALCGRRPDVEGIIWHAAAKEPGHVKLISDTRRIIVGNIDRRRGLYAEDDHLVGLMREAFFNEIELIRLRGGKGA